MNAENCMPSGSRQLMTDNDSQISKTDQFKVPQVQTCQSTTKLNSNSQSKINEFIGGSVIMQSRIVRRGDPPPLYEENKKLTEKEHTLISTPSSPFESQQPVFTQFNCNVPLANSHKSLMPEYDIDQRIADLVTSTNTQYHNKPPSSPITSTSKSVDPDVRMKSKNILPTRKSDIEDEVTHSVILVLTEGKGLAQGEIGLAAINLKRPVLILCQIIDTQNYTNTFKKINILDPSEALSSPQYPKMLEIIEITINKESTRSKGFAESQFQRCFAIKSNINPMLDAARTVYSELIQTFYEKVKILGRNLGTEHLIPKNSCKRGFHVQVSLKNIKNFDVKHPPSICKYVECCKSIMKFTTEDLLVLNYRINQALNQVETLTNQLLFEMFKELRKYINCIHNLCNSIADLDLIFSFAQYSMRSGLVRPMFGQCLDITNSRHPILDFINSTVPVANDIVSLIIQIKILYSISAMDRIMTKTEPKLFASTDKNLNIITGPNMGGKSIYIRQVALLQIVAQIGCYVPATKAQFRICDRLFTRIGFNDSMESNASTFVLEIKELNVILPSITKNSLIIIDELCRATSSEEGSSLAWAICEYIMQSCAFIFCATHNILITKLQDLYCNVVNYHMEALPVSSSKKTLFYTYKLQLGVTNIDDYGLTLARDVMPEHLVEHAIEIEKYLPRTKAALLDNPSNKEDLILDSCVQKLLQMKDNDCLDMFEMQSAVKEMMNELKENATKNSDSMDLIDSDEM